MDMSNDMDFEAEDRILELIMHPPRWDSDTDRMAQADIIRRRIYCSSENAFPGYYISDDGCRILVISVADITNKDRFCKRSEPKSEAKPEPYPRTQRPRQAEIREQLHQRNFALAWAALQQTQLPPTHYYAPREPIDVSHYPTPICAHSLESPVVGSTMGPAQGLAQSSGSVGIDITKAMESTALFTTRISWGADDAAVKISTADDDEEDEAPAGCNIGVETGSSLSWVYKQGFREIKHPRSVVRNEYVPITMWKSDTQTPESDVLLANRHMSVAFQSDLDKVDRFPKDEVLTYVDGTCIAAVPFTQPITFHQVDPEIRLHNVTFLGALGVNRRLMLRRGYDGLLGLSPRRSAFEDAVQSSTMPFLQQLRDLDMINNTKFYLSFGRDWADMSKLSLGGIKKSLSICYAWSPWVRVVDQEDLNWSMFLDSVSVHEGNGNGPLVETLSLVSGSDPCDESIVRCEVHFDTGCSLSHYNAPVLYFLLKNNLILLEGRHYFCNLDVASRHSIVFHFRSGCRRSTFSLELKGTMLGESTRHNTRVQGRSVSRATIQSAGDLPQTQIIWGNKQMRGMAIGFDCEQPPRMRFGV